MDIDEQLLLVREEDRETMRLFLEKIHVSRSKTTLLHIVSEYGTKRLVKICLRSGFDVNALDWENKTPLTLALRQFHISIMKTLLSAGADMFLCNPDGTTPLHDLFTVHSLDYEVYDIYFKVLKRKCSSSEEMAQMMLDHGCYLYQAAFSKDVKILEYMLNLDLVQDLPMKDVHSFYTTTALHIAVALDDVQSVNLLIKYGFDVQKLDIQNLSPIAYIYNDNLEHRTEKIEILKALLSAGVSPTFYALSSVFHTETILKCGNLEEIRVLLQWNADFSARDGRKRILLHYLATNSNPGIVEELKRLNVAELGINKIEEAGLTPLHFAVISQNVEMVQFLLEQGARTDYATHETDLTPLCFLSIESKEPNFKNRNLQNLELLLHHGADPQYISTNRDGSTLTIFSLLSDDFYILKRVIAHLAILEGLGTPINQSIYNMIKSDSESNEYFEKGKRILEICIHESVTVLDLLTANEKDFAKYLRNKHLVLKLKRILHKQPVKSPFSYYLNSIKLRFSKVMKIRMLKKEATEVIDNVFESYSIRNDLIIAETLKYFNFNDLQQLYLLKKDLLNF